MRAQPVEIDIVRNGRGLDRFVSEQRNDLRILLRRLCQCLTQQIAEESRLVNGDVGVRRIDECLSERRRLVVLPIGDAGDVDRILFEIGIVDNHGKCI